MTPVPGDNGTARLREAVAGLLPPGTRCALAGYPDHGNVGDPAIWLAARRLLRTLRVRVDYTCDYRSYHAAALRSAVPRGPIVLQGGGNLGNVYPNESGLRLRLLRDFPGRRIVQLPQSIWFTAAAAVEEWRQAFARHGNFALLVRDERSRDFARRRLGLEAVLCPDTSCALAAGELLPCPPPPDLDMLWLWRTDRESGGDTPPAVSGLRMDARDWPELELRGAPASGTIRHRAAAIHAELVRRRHLWTARIWWRLNGPSWEALARARVRRGLALLARGRVVITNRLHAGLLGEQIGRPVIFCPNANGKLRDYLDTWPGTSEPRRWAETPADALRQARALLDGAAEGAWDEKGGRVRGSG